jgi:hypothetical protein
MADRTPASQSTIEVQDSEILLGELLGAVHRVDDQTRGREAREESLTIFYEIRGYRTAGMRVRVYREVTRVGSR